MGRPPDEYRYVGAKVEQLDDQVLETQGLLSVELGRKVEWNYESWGNRKVDTKAAVNAITKEGSKLGMDLSSATAQEWLTKT